MFLEEVIEVGWFVEPQAIPYFRNVPVGMPKQGFGFPRQPVGNVIGRGLAGRVAHGAVEMIDVNG